jgi:hypothetical protein
LADRSTQLLLDALSRAAADPAGVPLYASKSAPGLFPATAAARHAARRCKDEDLVKVVRTEARGKAVQEVCALTDKGLAYLLSQVSPRQLLEDLVRAIEARQAQLADLVSAARATQTGLEAFRALAGKVLQQLNQPGGAAPACEQARPSANGAEAWTAAALAYLGRRQDAGAAQDCPLPELYEAARQAYPKLTLGEFHDGLRRLHGQGRIYLHPWTGPLYDLPEPACALLVGHEVAYYASLR